MLLYYQYNKVLKVFFLICNIVIYNLTIHNLLNQLIEIIEKEFLILLPNKNKNLFLIKSLKIYFFIFFIIILANSNSLEIDKKD